MYKVSVSQILTHSILSPHRVPTINYYFTTSAATVIVLNNHKQLRRFYLNPANIRRENDIICISVKYIYIKGGLEVNF